MNTQMINTAKTADTVVKILSTVLKVCAILAVIFAVLVMIFGEKVLDTTNMSMDLDFIKIHLSKDYRPAANVMKAYLAIGLVSAAVAFVMISVCCGHLRKILAPMMEGRPFDASVPGELRKAAWVVLACGVVVELLGMAERLLATYAYPMDAMLSSAAIADWEVLFTLDGTFILMFFVMMLLSYVFSYGVQLQKESDETL